MRHGLQLAGITLLWLVGLNIDWDCLVPHCIMGSRDQWEFPLFPTTVTVPLHCRRLPLGLCNGLWKSVQWDNIIFWLSQNKEIMLISVSSPPTEPNFTAPAWKMASGITIMRKSVIRFICAYLMSYDAGFQKHPRSCPNECASQTWDQLTKHFFIDRANGAFLMNIAKICVK